MMKHEAVDDDEVGHSKLPIAAGAVGVAALGAAAAAFYKRKQRVNLLRTYDIENDAHLEATGIFDEKRLALERRELMAAVAVRIVYASTETQRGVVTRPELQQALGVRRYTLQQTLSYLMDTGLVERAASDDEGKRQGYRATDVLTGEVEQGHNPLLLEAQHELYAELASGSL